MPKEPTPKVGDVVRYDGAEHQVTAVQGTAVAFGDPKVGRVTDRQHLQSLEPGIWGVIGREAKRPYRPRVGVETSPATPKEG